MRCKLCDWSPENNVSLFNTSLPKSKRRVTADPEDETATLEHRRHLILDKTTNDHMCTECLAEIEVIE